MTILSFQLFTLLAVSTTAANAEYTRWLTTTCFETAWKTPEKVYEYVTSWDVKWSTIYATQYESTTIYQPTTVVQPTTIVETCTVTTTDTVFSTLNNYYTDYSTEVKVYHETETETATTTATATVTSATVFSTTELHTVTETCSPSLTGLVPCASRIVNPTYTATKPIPSDWLWGCPPGTLCTPKQDGCNFEANLPGENYYCSPDECMPIPKLTEYSVAEVDFNCTPYVPVPGYFNLNPQIFELDFDIFQFNGQAGPSCTEWQDWTPAPTPVVEASSWADWEPSPVQPSSLGHEAPKGSDSWADWSPQESHGKPFGQPHGPRITPKAVLEERQESDPTPPEECYAPCNAAVYEGQNCGFTYSRLCPSASAFSQRLGLCGNCITSRKELPPWVVTALISEVVTFVDFCETGNPQVAAATSTSTSSTATGSA